MTDAPLREGFTTGSAATAAAMAALSVLLGGIVPAAMEIPLPVKGTLGIPIARVELSGTKARGIVIKDGGDDPDVTHGEEIHAEVELIPGDEVRVDLCGGRGVGRVTLPGLPVPVGEAAINPAPRRQIISGVLRELSASGTDFCGTVRVCIEVPRGAEIAALTMNPRLGIVGGISILGTQGIIRPFSHASWKASIAQSLSVIRASGGDEAVFTTGRRSEEFYLNHFPGTGPARMVQAADFFKFSMLQARAKRLKKVHWAIFIGKLVKHAQGFPYTHAKDWAIDFPLLADWCAQLGLTPFLTAQIRTANTARQVLEMIPRESQATFIRMLMQKARKNALRFSGCDALEIHYYLFDFDGNMISNNPLHPQNRAYLTE
ncbi:cobalt-precorrin-5B (C(1))-methyltransferase CbiD [Maridesulfovibrio sp. FT414]|uniref:cobalt-precorrin-5B (C(1))-methyltransferase CbiD n=1 Tax=Maridesulfovibrio sp. FT414 TaxID=2979469 RepID=UPI003D800B6E